MITTAGHTRWPSDYPIHDLRPTGSRVDCAVRWKLFTLDNRALQRRIGQLADRDTHGCRAALAAILDSGALQLSAPGRLSEGNRSRSPP